MTSKKKKADELLHFTFGEIEKIVDEKSSELVEEKKQNGDEQQPEDRQENLEQDVASEKVDE